MRMMKSFLIAIGAVMGVALIFVGTFYWKNLRGLGPAIGKPTTDITKVINTTGMPLTLPTGFSISIFAKDLGKPRVLAFDAHQTLLVSIPESGTVVALPDADHDGIADQAKTVVEGLNKPHGLAFKGADKLYVAETNAVAVYDYDQTTLSAKNRKKLFDLPSGGNHTTRTLLFADPPENSQLLISIGSTCNVCVESDPQRAKILVANADGSDLKEYVKGTRNSVFMTNRPHTSEVWATDNSRDLLGDDIPPDEVNIIQQGKDYGWPICYGKNVYDPTVDARGSALNPCLSTVPSHIDIQAHSAPLGLRFSPVDLSWSKEYSNNLFVAFHGSWNRTVPTGYKVVRYVIGEDGKAGGAQDFITGWLQDKDAVGRPVDLIFGPDNTLYISDDKAGVIYRVTYTSS